MNEFIKKSQIVITHGGPGSIFHVIQNGKIPIVVPRNSSFNEHVDDHQILFTKRMQKENKIIAVYDIKDLGDKISNYLSLKNKCNIIKNNKNIFIEKFDMKIREIIKR